jgi:hypothetical protein
MDRNIYFFYPELVETPESRADCDMELVQASQYLMIDAVDKKQAAHIAQNVIDYLKDCNTTFLASERIRHLLLFSLFITSLIALISITLIPVASVSITLMVLLAITLFVINIAMTLTQSNHHQQQQDWNRLKTVCAQSEPKRCKKTKLLRPAHKLELTPEKTPEKPQFGPLFNDTRKNKAAKQLNISESRIEDESAINNSTSLSH